jgi:hypothetical protein
MYHSKLRVEVEGTSILVIMRGTCLRARYRRQEAPWLATDEFGPDDPDAPMTMAEFRGLAWTAANETARQLGWIKSYEEVHHTLRQDRI